MSEKIQKVLANAGVGSRRQIEQWIAAGRITVDGKPATIGCRINEKAKICIDNKLIKWQPQASDRTRILIYHKPEGEIATRSDPQGRPTVFDNLPPLHRQRWIQVGRLDINTSGLLIFTTNGELANYLMHPRYEFEREYSVRVMGTVTPQAIENLKKGVMLDDGLAHFDQIIKDPGGTGINHWYHVIIKEGRQREVRRLWETQGVQVSRLIRVRYGSVALPRMLRPGRYEEMPARQVQDFLEKCGFAPEAQEHSERGKPTRKPMDMKRARPARSPSASARPQGNRASSSSSTRNERSNSRFKDSPARASKPTERTSGKPAFRKETASTSAKASTGARTGTRPSQVKRQAPTSSSRPAGNRRTTRDHKR